MSFVSYAQNFEDVLLHRVFGGQETGFYIDVGAYHPVLSSVTKAFYDKGWSGINVEPGSVFAELAAARPRDVNLQIAVFDHAGQIAFLEDDADRGMSRVLMGVGGADTADAPAPRMVPCETLQAIVDTYSLGRPVDFIKVDAEGAETAIVQSTDWRRLRPRVLLLEATRPWSSLLANQDWEPALLQQGYVRAYFDGINCFYIPEEESAALLRHFQVPVNILDRAERHQDVAARADLHARQAEVERLVAEAGAARTAQNTTGAEVTRLTAERDAARFARDAAAAEVARLVAERDAAHTARDVTAAEVIRLTMERDAARTALGAAEAEVTRLSAERKAALDATAAELARLIAERDEARCALDTTTAEVARLTAERDAAHAALDAKRAEAARLANTLRTLEAGPQPAPEMPVATRPAPTRARSTRRAARAAYMLVRPVIRPVAWRLRTFMTGELARQISQLDRGVVVLPAAAEQSRLNDEGTAADMRRLASEMERTLLTLSLERAPERWSEAPIAVLPRKPQGTFVLPSTFQSFPVSDGSGTELQMVVEADNLSQYDRSIFENRSYGDLARLFLRLLRGDGTLIDLGANIGTVCLPVAAAGSRVIAVEMLPSNSLKLTLAVLVNQFPHFRVVQAAATNSEGLVGYEGESAWGQVSQSPTAQYAAGLRLDSILELVELENPWFLKTPIAMKIDIEGHELAALHGAERFLREQKPIFVFESVQAAYDAPGHTQDVKRFLCDRGYSLHMIRGKIISPHFPDDDQISLVSDILAIPDGKMQFVADRLSDYELRELSPDEQIAWLAEIAPQGDLHRRHVAAVIPKLRNFPPVKSADLERLMDYDYDTK